MKYKTIFFVGIKGVGMTSLSVLAKQAGFLVVGSDVDNEFITDTILHSENIQVSVGFGEKVISDLLIHNSASQLLIIYTGAHGGAKNPQVQYAQASGIRTLNYGQALGKFMIGEIIERGDIESISVAACHGKTTISAMLATFLTKLNFDPSYVIGTSEVFPLGPAGHYGRGKYFVAEADEYVADPQWDRTPKFFYQKPDYAIFNNIDYDHPDVFATVDEVEAAFHTLAKQIKKGGILVMNGDDRRLRSFKKKLDNQLKIITYGVGGENDYSIEDYHESGFTSSFRVESKVLSLGKFNLSVPGFHNAKNALSTLALLVELGVPAQNIARVFPMFAGTKRRMEKIGVNKNGAQIIDDYAHHPQEIKTTLRAIREVYPGKQIVAIFQPHTYSRTHAFLSEFVSSFTVADIVCILPTYASARESETFQDEEGEFKKKFEQIGKPVIFPKNIDYMVEYVSHQKFGKESIIVIMGAGDVYKIASGLLAFSV